jgi:hypothetical protein
VLKSLADLFERLGAMALHNLADFLGVLSGIGFGDHQRAPLAQQFTITAVAVEKVSDFALEGARGKNV